MLSRRTLLASAGLAVLAGCTPAAVPRPSATPTGDVRAQLDEVFGVLAGGEYTFGVAVEDLRSGGSYRFAADYTGQSASMAKPMIVSMAQRAARGAGGLAEAQAELARRAITVSDNDAADALWAYAGTRPAYDALARDLGMADTHSAPERDFWSWTWTTPADQLVLLRALAEGGSDALTDAEGRFTWELMGQVRDDQAWGVGQPRGGDVAVHLKNGWVQFQSTDGLWAVNSLGAVSGQGRDYRLCVMSRVRDFDTGKALADEVGKWVFSVLGGGTL